MNSRPATEFISDLSTLVPDWDDYVLAHPEGTFFHLSGWGRVLEKTFSYRPMYGVARRGGRICAVLPMFQVRTLIVGHALVSIPLAVYGGVRADDAEAAEVLLTSAQKLANELNVKYLELRHEKPLGDLPFKDLYVTFRKEIHQEEAKNLAEIPRKQRRMVRQGEKFSLDVRIGGNEILGEFYGVYSESVRNLGTPVFPLGLFRELLEEFGERCMILGVFHDGQMAAGVMTFFFRDQIMPYYGGALSSKLRFAVNDFMYWKLLCYGAEQGYRIFDFGRSKKGTGAYDFKRHWGFEPTPLAYQYHLVGQRTIPDSNPLNPKLALPIEVWKRLPLPLTQWIGPKIVRFFP